MGMSASQVRFLSLQHRKHNIGTQLTSLANKKMALSRDMNRVSKNYTNALNQKVLKWSNNNGISYQNLTYNMMMSPNEANTSTPYIVTDAKTGKVVLNNDIIKNYEGKTIYDENNVAVTYASLADMISTYSGMTADNKMLYNNPGQIKSGSAIVGGNPAIDNAYYIPDVKTDYTFNNSLRFEIFKKLGLVSEAQKTQQTSLLTALYGSKEAQETGVYPVGSAYGDYYLALANLEAYDDFVAQRHSMATSDTYYLKSGQASQNQNVTFVDRSEDSEDYTYMTVLNTEGATATTITQSLRDSSALDKVNLNALVGTDKDGNMTTYYRAGQTIGDSETVSISDGIGFNAQHDTVFDKYTENVSNAYTSGGSENAISYGMTLTDHGMVYTYTMDNVWQNALKKYTPGTNSYVDAARAGSDGVGVDDGMITLGSVEEIYNYTSRNLTGSDGIETRLMSALNAYGNVLSQSTFYESSWSSAIKKAKDSTFNLFKSQMYTQTYSPSMKHDDFEGSAKPDAAGAHRNSIYFANKDYPNDAHWFGFIPLLGSIGAAIYGASRHKRSAAYVDATALLNTFLTYFDYYLKNPNMSAPVATYSVEGKDPVGNTGKYDTTTDGANKTSWVYDGTNSDGTAKYKLSKYVFDITKTSTNTDGSGNRYKGGTRFNLSSSASSNADTVVYLTENSSTAGFVLSNEDSSHKYKCYMDLNHPEAFEYKANFGAFDFVAYDGSTKSIVGVISKGTSQFLLKGTSTKAQNAMKAYVNNQESLERTNDNSIKIGTYVLAKGVDYDEVGTVGSSATSFTGPDLEKSKDANGADYKVHIYANFNSSEYDIETKVNVEKDDTYRKHLMKKVEEAQDRIEKGKVDLEYFYANADSKMMDFYDALFLKIAQSGWMIDDSTSTSNSNHIEYLNNKLQNNDYFVTECTERVDYTGFNYTTKQATSVTKIYEVRDESAENAALAQYETEKTLISSKERRIDMQMTKLETEQEAVNTEMQSVKKVMTENIDKTFKIFA